MKVMMAGAALLLGAGGALAQAKSTQALEAAQSRLTDCFERNATALDDRASDAATVARAVLANCWAERSVVEDAARASTGGSGMNTADKALVREGLIDRATVVVLTLRKARKP